MYYIRKPILLLTKRLKNWGTKPMPHAHEVQETQDQRPIIKELENALARIDNLEKDIERLQIPHVHEVQETQDQLPIIKELENALARIDNLEKDIERLQNIMFQDIPQEIEKQNIQFFDRMYKINGPLRSTAELDEAAKIRTEVYFHHRDKAEIALTVGSSWYGGDYFEFGAQDLNTFRNMLSAYDICGMARATPDVRFYAFDVFGNPKANSPENGGAVPDKNFVPSFGHYLHDGDQIKLHQEYLEQHKIYKKHCFLIQGLFENTLTEQFKANYKSENRKIGFAFLDCNMASSYQTVFEFIFDLMAEESHIYMDEYFQNPAVTEYYRDFCDKLAKQRNIGSVYIRNAGGFGGLFRLYPLGVNNGKYDVR